MLLVASDFPAEVEVKGDDGEGHEKHADAENVNVLFRNEAGLIG